MNFIPDRFNIKKMPASAGFKTEPYREAKASSDSRITQNGTSVNNKYMTEDENGDEEIQRVYQEP